MLLLARSLAHISNMLALSPLLSMSLTLFQSVLAGNLGLASRKLLILLDTNPYKAMQILYSDPIFQ